MPLGNRLKTDVMVIEICCVMVLSAIQGQQRKKVSTVSWRHFKLKEVS
jgi:hypothetical protein